MNQVPHYNAFISYRHHPQDIAVAEAIHKGLERFKIPSSLKKQGKKINRIFRDKEELPITSSLTDTITTALRNSDFQIVICSTHLKDSYWVQREIETFLQSHTKDQILTVIVDGEPQDVIPEILTYREVTDPLTGRTIREPLEPLSCDWRLPKRKAMKTELPRLAAVLLGCTYNDLIQRQKQYRMQRLLMGGSAALALSVGFAAYFLYSSIQIQDNLNHSLMNQSQYLASTAATLFEEGNRLTAIALALEALPSSEQDRPYVVAAEQSLSDALMLYEPNKTIIAVGAYTADAPVNDFTLTDDGRTLYILDSAAGMTVWDTDTFEKLGSFPLEKSYSPLCTDAQGNLVTKDGPDEHCLRSFSPNGTLRWEVPDIYSMAFTTDKSLLLATTRDDTANYLLTLDPNTGERLREPIFISTTAETSFVKLESKCYYAQHPYLLTLYGTPEDSVVLLEPDSGKLTTLINTEHLIYHQNMTADGRALLNLSDGSGIMNGIIMDLTTVSPANGYICCFNTEGKQLWRTQLMNYMYCSSQTLEAIPDSPNIFVQFGNNLSVLSGKDGSVLAQCHSIADPLTMEVGTDSAWGFFTDGTMGNFYYDTQEISTIRYMEAGLTQAIVNNGGYTSKALSRSVTKYANAADDSYEEFDGSHDSYISHCFLTQDHAAISSYNVMAIYDLNTRTAILRDEEWESYWALLGFSEDKSKFCTGYRYDGLHVYDLSTGSKTLRPFPTDGQDPALRTTEKMLLHRDHLYYTLYNTADFSACLVDWDLNTDTYTLIADIPPELTKDLTAHGVGLNPIYADDTKLLLNPQGGTLYEYRFADGSWRLVSPDAGEHPVYLADPNADRILLASGQEIRVLDADRSVTETLCLPDTAAVSLALHEGILYALCADGCVYRFTEGSPHPETITLSLYSNYYTDIRYPDSMNVPFTWAFTPDGEVILGAAEMGNIIPDGQGTRRADIPHFLCYHAPTDSLIAACDGSQLIAYDRLTTAQVMERGRDVLGSFTLTEDLRNAYGLS